MPDPVFEKMRRKVTQTLVQRGLTKEQAMAAFDLGNKMLEWRMTVPLDDDVVRAALLYMDSVMSQSNRSVSHVEWDMRHREFTS